MPSRSWRTSIGREFVVRAPGIRDSDTAPTDHPQPAQATVEAVAAVGVRLMQRLTARVRRAASFRLAMTPGADVSRRSVRAAGVAAERELTQRVVVLRAAGPGPADRTSRRTRASVAVATAATLAPLVLAPAAAATATPTLSTRARANTTLTRALPRTAVPAASRTSTRATSATATLGHSCSRFDAVAGTLVCLHSGGRLTWHRREKQAVTADLPVTAALSAGPIAVTARASSGLRLALGTATPSVCHTSQAEVLPVAVGTCEVLFTQAGTARYLPVRASLTVTFLAANTIAFTLPSTIALASGTEPLAATSTSGDVVTFTSSTPSTCAVDGTALRLLTSGTCTVVASQPATARHLAATPVTASMTIANTRTSADLADVAQGYQIHAVYVVPSDGTDHALDTNGQLATILTDGNSLLQQDIARQVRIDSTATGYDISYLHTRLTTAQVQTSTTLTTDLLTEIGAFDNASANRKDWVFFVDVPAFQGGEACGYAGVGGVSAVVALQGSCGQQAFGLHSIASVTWVHEWFHNLGVNHTASGVCDLMLPAPTCPLDGHMNIDVNHTGYVGSSAQGVDVLTLPVWTDPTLGTAGALGCELTPATRAGGVDFAYCSTGTQHIGALQYCWSALNGPRLQQNLSGQWVDVAAGSGSTQPWNNASWTCGTSGYTAPTALVTQTTPGLVHYRWLDASGRVLESLDVIWAQ